jgi:hypothetical protein
MIPPIPCCANCKRAREMHGKSVPEHASYKCSFGQQRREQLDDQRGDWRPTDGWCPLHKFRSEAD